MKKLNPTTLSWIVIMAYASVIALIVYLWYFYFKVSWIALLIIFIALYIISFYVIKNAFKKAERKLEKGIREIRYGK